MPINTRRVELRFDANRDSGGTNDSYFDHAFLLVVDESFGPDQGAYGHSPDETSGAQPHLQLAYPDLYTDWELNVPHTIRWNSFGNSGNSAVRIDLYRESPEGPAFVATIMAATPDDGQHIWIPSTINPFGQPPLITNGTHGLRLQISLVNNQAVLDRSTEPFSIPESGTTYYVDDASNENDAYTPLAVGSNRYTGKLPTAPKPNPYNLLRIYTLGAGGTVNVDTGAYPMIYPLKISGSSDLGVGLDEGFTLRGPIDTARTVSLFPAIPGNRPEALIELYDADFMTLHNLTVSTAQRGLWVRGGSDSVSVNFITAFDHTYDGIRIENGSPNSVFDHLTAYNSGDSGIYISGAILGLTNALVHDNQDYGIYLYDSGNALVQSSQIYNNGGYYGMYVSNGNSSTRTFVGSTDLSLGLGNVVYNNATYGIYANGYVTVAGNTVYGHTGANDIGIYAYSGNVQNNVVYGNYIGIYSGYNTGGEISGNRVYANTSSGIYVNAYGGHRRRQRGLFEPHRDQHQPL